MKRFTMIIENHKIWLLFLLFTVSAVKTANAQLIRETNRGFIAKPKTGVKTYAFDLSLVQLFPSSFKKAMDLDATHLLSLDSGKPPTR